MKTLNMMAPIGFTGYGITSYNIYKSLKRLGLDICLFPIGNPSIDDENEKTGLLEDIGKQLHFSNDSFCFKIWHQYDLATRIGSSKFFALTFFEVDRLKPQEIVMINNLDGIFVASEWAKNILLANNITTNIFVSPLGIDPAVFNVSVQETVKRDDNKYIFLNIGKWEIRKGHDVLVEAFNDAFSEEDNVELWMLNYNPFLNQQQNSTWVNLYKNSKLGQKIKIVPRVQSHKDLAKLICLADCGVFPARAEGWNNEVPEFYALNKPVILTNYSAHTQYATNQNSYLIDIDSLTEAVDDKFFDGYGKWANFGENQHNQLVEHMRYVYTNNIKSNPGGLETASKLTWDHTAKIIHSNIYG